MNVRECSHKSNKENKQRIEKKLSEKNRQQLWKYTAEAEFKGPNQQYMHDKLRKSTEYRRKSSYSVFAPDTTMESRRLALFTSHSPARTCSVALTAYD